MNKLRIFLADDHHVVRAGIKALINNQPDMDVIGEAGDGRSALDQAAQLTPDVLVIDISIPVIGGAEVTRLLRQTLPEVKILALTVHEEPAYVEQLFRAGAAGYVLKRAVADDLIHAIRTVANGGAYLDPTIAGLVMGGFAKGHAPAKTERAGGLTDREAEILQLVAKGYTGRDIAAQLELSVKTVDTHKSRAMEKLGLASRADIVSYAVQHGWLTTSRT
jgi:DNA-binding NarL/FixJ family response regulator